MKQIAAALHPNEVATGLKLVDVDTAAALRDGYTTLYLAQPYSVWEDAERPHQAQQPWPGPAFVAHWGSSEPWRALTLPQRRRLLCLAASSGHAGSLDAALAHCGCTLTPEVLTAAAAAGNAAGCERLLGGGVAADWRTVTAAAKAGDLPVLQLLLWSSTGGQRCRLYYDAVRGACAGGHAHVLAWLQQAHGYQPSLEGVEAAARAGQVAMLELLLPPPPPQLPRLAPAHAAAAAGDGDRFRLDHGLLWEPAAAAAAAGSAAAAAAPVQNPHAPRRRADNRLRLLLAIIHGCPVEVLQRHYEPLSQGWVPARPPEGAAAAQAAAWAVGGGVGAADAELLHRILLASLLTSALGSPTACWGAKLDFLLTSWGPPVTNELVRDVAVCDKAAQAATIRLDCLQRLQWLRPQGFQFGTRAAELVSAGGHAAPLAYLWDECGVPGPMGTPDPVGVFLRGCSQAVPRCYERGAGARFLRVLQLLAARDAALSAEHAAMAADCLGPEPMLLYLAEAAEPVAERGGDAWNRAFSRARGGSRLGEGRGLAAAS
ncbi:hypothetical protein HXX76_015222 [Chlamydomonas incerta]|uniref:Uncharacterized protein n=1 Tax=Chlamydomonas incerta TaxID=51695 RepID=A0A835VRW5_CHLIN|nr:hypothetical protein HXX76_015222 [Chlamydomonas incerta]|eukprot:KAG2423583.1 hypothetical protein HXX76_015222 [Chlamydomonas incerta]